MKIASFPQQQKQITFIIVVNQMQNESCRTDAKIVSKE